MKLGIINCDEIVEPLRDEYIDYPNMFRNRFSGLDPHLDYRFYCALENRYPESLDECDAYLITGSKTGVYDDVHWLEELAGFIGDVYAADIPLVGICFGHQMIAHTLGGKAEKSQKGWGLGVCTYELSKPQAWMTDLAVDEYSLLYSHQDQVTAIPPEAETIAESEFCAHAAYVIENKVLGIQGHPEFPPEYLRELMLLRRERYPEEKFEQAFASLSEKTHSDVVSRWIIAFIRHGANK